MDISVKWFLTSTTAAVCVAALTLTPLMASDVVRIAESPAVQLTSDAPILDATSFATDIEMLYNALEPWAAYGVNTLSWAVGWVPVAGLLAPQLIFFYDLGEPIVQSTLFNTLDALSGTISVAEALSNIQTATTDAFNAFVSTEIGWIESMLPPAPPADALAEAGNLFIPFS